jgi:hypothetical protein
MASGNAGLNDEIPLGFFRATPFAPFVHPKLPLPHGWDIAGERARPGCRFRRRAVGRVTLCAPFPAPLGAAYL